MDYLVHMRSIRFLVVHHSVHDCFDVFGHKVQIALLIVGKHEGGWASRVQHAAGLAEPDCALDTCQAERVHVGQVRVVRGGREFPLELDVGVTHDLAWAHVLVRAAELVRLRVLQRDVRWVLVRQTKVDHLQYELTRLGQTIVGDHDIVRLDVVVDNAGTVHEGQCATDLAHEAHEFSARCGQHTLGRSLEQKVAQTCRAHLELQDVVCSVVGVKRALVALGLNELHYVVVRG